MRDPLSEPTPSRPGVAPSAAVSTRQRLAGPIAALLVVSALGVGVEPATGSVETPAGESASYFFALAQLYADEGRIEDAGEQYARAVGLDSTDPYLRLSYADFLFRNGLVAEASEQLAVALEGAPDDLQALQLAARVELAQVARSPEAVSRAIKALERIRQLDPNDLDSRVALGRLYAESGRSSDAVEIFEEMLTLLPGNRRIQTLFVDALMRPPVAEDAETKLVALLTTSPDFLPARLALAQTLAEKGDFGGVVSTLQAAPVEQQDQDELLTRLAGALYHTAQLAEANRALDELLTRQPDDPTANFFKTLVLLAEGENAAAETVVRGMLDSNTGDRQLVQLLSRSLEAQGKWEELTTLLDGSADLAAGADDEDAAVGYRLALTLALARGERWDEVLARSRARVAEAPGDVDANLLVAEALQRLERTDEAIELLAGLTVEPEVARDVKVRVAQYLFEAGRDAEATEQIEQLLAGDDVDAQRAAAEVFQRLERYSESIPHLERVRESEGSLDALFWLAAAYERVGRHDDAVSTFRAVLEERPDFAPALNYLGYMWAERGENLEEALELIGRAVELDPSNGAYVDSLGWALYQDGRYDEAKVHLERASRLVPDDAVVLEHLADAYARSGDVDGARQLYSQAAELDGENVQTVREKLRQLDGR